MTPAQQRRDRILRLTRLIRQASAELEKLQAAEFKIQRLVPQDVPVEAEAGEASTASAVVINRWAWRTGLIDHISPGRIRREIRVAYLEAGEPDGR